jgi:hypothetical protein
MADYITALKPFAVQLGLRVGPIELEILRYA